MKTIAVVNQKGGCGKTTTAVNLAAALAEQDQNVLLLDLDPQAHATIGLGHDPDGLRRSVYEAITRPQVTLADVLLPTRRDRLRLAPSSVMLASVDVELVRVPNRELILGRALRSVRDQFDLCVMDCAPSFGILTIGALVASSDVLVPVQAHYYSMEGLRRVLETIRLIRERFHPCSAGSLSILLTLVEDRTTLSKQIQSQMREIFGSLVFQTVIHNSVRLCEAPSAGESVLDYAPRSRGALEYRALAAEILGNVPPVESAGRGSSRRGIQKDLSELFGRLHDTAEPAARPSSRGARRASLASEEGRAPSEEGRGTSDASPSESNDAQVHRTEAPCDPGSESEELTPAAICVPAFVGPGAPSQGSEAPQ